MTLLTRRAVVLADIEAVYDVAETLAGATDGILVSEPDYTVDPTVLERNNVRDSLSPEAHVIGRKLAGMTFTCELRGNGIQNAGTLINAPKLARLLRGCGYSITAVAAAEPTGVYDIDFHANTVAWTDSGTLTNTTLIGYILTVVLGGVSGVATISVAGTESGEDNAAAVVTTATPFTVGSKGLLLTPVFTGSLVAGQKWAVWLLPTGLMMQPISDGFESLTIEMFLDGVKHQMTGAYGTFSINAEAGQYGTIEFTFTGTYIAPTDVALPTPTYERTLPSQVEQGRLYFDGFATCVNAFTFEQGNDIQVRPCINGEDGYDGVRLVARAPEGGIDPEAALVASHDFWARLASAKRMPFQVRVGTVAGNIVWFLAPAMQYTGLTYADRNGIRTYDAGLKFSAYSGDDEMQIFLA